MARNKRPYNYNGSKKRKNNKSKKKSNNLENTVRIRIDDDRLNDIDSLDTSFLEGRANKRKRNKKRRRFTINFKLIRGIIIGVVFLCVFGLIIMAFVNGSFDRVHVKSNRSSNSTKIIDNNYLFVGDYYTGGLKFKDYHYIKDSDDDMDSSSLLSDIRNRIYVYNPSHVFITIGINDLDKDVSNEKIINNIESIIKGIKSNRSFAKIYIESIYPINKDMDNYDDSIVDVSNDKIRDLNKELKVLCSKYSVNYIDMYSLLVKDGKLNSNYTSNGVYLNDKGYKVVYKKINEIIG